MGKCRSLTRYLSWNVETDDANENAQAINYFDFWRLKCQTPVKVNCEWNGKSEGIRRFVDGNRRKNITHLFQIQCDCHVFVFAVFSQRWTLPPFRRAVNHIFDGMSSFCVVCIADATLGFALTSLWMRIDCITKFFARQLTACCIRIQNCLRSNIEYRRPQTGNRFIGSNVRRVFHIGDKSCKNKRKKILKILNIDGWVDEPSVTTIMKCLSHR